MNFTRVPVTDLQIGHDVCYNGKVVSIDTLATGLVRVTTDIGMTSNYYPTAEILIWV